MDFNSYLNSQNNGTPDRLTRIQDGGSNFNIRPTPSIAISKPNQKNEYGLLPRQSSHMYIKHEAPAVS